MAIDWVLDDTTRAWVVSKPTPHPLKRLEASARVHAGILAALPRALPRTSPSSGVYQPFFERARAGGWRCRELTGGHYAMLTVRNVVVTALLELADERGAR